MGPGPCRTMEAVTGARAFPKRSGSFKQLPAGGYCGQMCRGGWAVGGQEWKQRTSYEALAVVSRGGNPQRGSDSRDGVGVCTKSY